MRRAKTGIKSIDSRESDTNDDEADDAVNHGTNKRVRANEKGKIGIGELGATTRLRT